MNHRGPMIPSLFQHHGAHHTNRSIFSLERCHYKHYLHELLQSLTHIHATRFDLNKFSTFIFFSLGLMQFSRFIEDFIRRNEIFFSLRMSLFSEFLSKHSPHASHAPFLSEQYSSWNIFQRRQQLNTTISNLPISSRIFWTVSFSTSTS